MDLNVKVAVRCRPMNSKEINRGNVSIVKMTNNTVTITDKENAQKDFTFDYCYFIDSTQEEVYTDLGQPMVTQVREICIDRYKYSIYRCACIVVICLCGFKCTFKYIEIYR